MPRAAQKNRRPPRLGRQHSMPQAAFPSALQIRKLGSLPFLVFELGGRTFLPRAAQKNRRPQAPEAKGGPAFAGIIRSSHKTTAPRLKWPLRATAGVSRAAEKNRRPPRPGRQDSMAPAFAPRRQIRKLGSLPFPVFELGSRSPRGSHKKIGGRHRPRAALRLREQSEVPTKQRRQG